MTVESDITRVDSCAISAGTAGIGEMSDKGASSSVVAEVLGQVPDGAPGSVASAPGRVDIMGGLAEYAGSLVLNMPLAERACVAIQRRSEPDLSIRWTPSLGLDGREATVLPMSKLLGPDGAPVDTDRGRALTQGQAAHHLRCIVGAIVEMFRSRPALRCEGGLSVVGGSKLDDFGDAGRDAAMTAATIVALAGVFDVPLDPTEGMEICQRVENEWLDAPVGAADAACALAGQANTLTEVRTESGTLAGSVCLPEDLVLFGVDCGVVHPEWKLRYERVRTAAFMGRELIERIVRHDELSDLQWNGHVSHIRIADYVGQFRDRLPTKLKGSDYLERFGETGDPLTRIDPSFNYKIRSRTEHHIYEHARARDLVECLRHAIDGHDERSLIEAGELMYASHWSYGQRCGLGSIETDFLVNAMRRQGVEAGIYGAKISGRGCGGTVAVLMRPSEKAWTAIDAAMSSYESKTGHKATLLRGSSPGAIVDGAQRV